MTARIVGYAGMFLALATTAGAQAPAVRLDAAALFQRCSPAVVTLQTPSGFGSGVIIDAAGIIVTNLHVIRGESKARVVLANGEAFEDVQVIDVDARRDLAVLRIKGQGLPTVAIGDSDAVAIGHTLYAIGTPKGLERSLSQGILSGRRERDGYRVLQTTAAISPGSSGGALLNERGELVGITTFQINGGENLNFAVPMIYVRALLPGGPPTTLAALAERYPKEEPATGAAPSGSAPVPQLARAYAAANGSIASFEQAGASVQTTWRTDRGEIYGKTAFAWDVERQVFAGEGEVKTVCTAPNGAALMLPVKEEIVILDAKTILNRWTKPIGLSCAKGAVDSYVWEETLWSVVEK